MIFIGLVNGCICWVMKCNVKFRVFNLFVRVVMVGMCIVYDFMVVCIDYNNLCI